MVKKKKNGKRVWWAIGTAVMIGCAALIGGAFVSIAEQLLGEDMQALAIIVLLAFIGLLVGAALKTGGEKGGGKKAEYG